LEQAELHSVLQETVQPQVQNVIRQLLQEYWQGMAVVVVG